MKLNITVEIDYMDEEGNLDETVKESIINGVCEKISRKCIANIEAKANEQISLSLSTAKTLIENKAVAFAESWLKTDVSITDKWGKVVEKSSIEDLVKKSFDNTLLRHVDRQGNLCDGTRHESTRLIDWLTTTKMQEIVSKKLDDMSKHIDESIKKSINDTLKKNVSDKFAEMILKVAKESNIV